MFEPSKYQIDIFNWMQNAKPGNNLVVNAVAGSGKTSTIERAVRLIPSGDSVLSLQFNTHIAQEMKSRLPDTVQVSTLNSFGWSICRSNVKGAQLKQYKTFDFIDTLIPDKEDAKAWKGPMSRIISLKKACPSLEAAEIVKRFDLEIPTDTLQAERFMDACKMVWLAVAKSTAQMDFDDQIFFPVYKKWELPKYDWVFIDECQDLSEVQIKMVQRLGKRVIAVGDPYQAIYGFRGACPDAVEKIIAALDAKVLPLSVCYRCPKKVVQEAQKIVPHIEFSPTAIDGVVDTVETPKFKAEAKDKDWVLCRITAPLVKRCLQFIAEKRKATVKGRDIGKNIISLIDKINSYGDYAPLTQFAPEMREWYQAEAERLEAAGREGQLESIEDRVMCIEALSEGSKTVADVKGKIFKIFSDEDSAGVTFATAHRSKGLEEKQIYLLRPDLMPFPKAKSDWQKQQEKNLQYVATTRAKERFTYITPEPDEVKRRSK